MASIGNDSEIIDETVALALALAPQDELPPIHDLTSTDNVTIQRLGEWFSLSPQGTLFRFMQLREQTLMVDWHAHFPTLQVPPWANNIEMYDLETYERTTIFIVLEEDGDDLWNYVSPHSNWLP